LGGNYNEDTYIAVEDNGRGITQEEFVELSKPYTRKEGQKEMGTGLGLNICIQILKEHNFSVKAEKTDSGTKIKIFI
jgi:K+-sensing histidine kinase KdpD